MRFKCSVSSVKLFVLATTLCLSFIIAPLLVVASVSAQTPVPTIDPNQYAPQPSNEGPSQTPVATNGEIKSTVNIIISADGKAGTYGPLTLDIFDSSNAKKDSTTTTTATSDSKSKMATPLAVTAAFSGIKIGKYKICLSGSTTLCTSLFDRAANGDMTAPTITIQASESDKFFTATPATGADARTCGSEVQAIGWLVCPIINMLTGLNDAMWGIVSSLLTVNPLNQNDAIYTAWGSIRSIANVLFALFFLIIIFSQLSSVGITNYGVKKMLPRLIVCAIMVNVSFIIVQVMVDLANILGSSLYNLLISITGEVSLGWGSLVNLITGTGVGVALTVGGIALAGGVAAAFWMLLPMALMAMLGLLTAVLTLIFRQAVIPVLAILAPLAFVAYLLPNTEQWFKKWRDMLMSMLMLYPMAALVFGGAQFAAYVIIDDGTDWWKLLIGLIVLAIPLFSLPFLARQGGPILSKVSGALGKIAENARAPLKGWGKGHADNARSEYQSDTRPPGALRSLAERNRFTRAIYNSPRRFNQGGAARRGAMEDRTEAANKEFESKRVNNEVRGVFGRTVDGHSAAERLEVSKQHSAIDQKNLQAGILRTNPTNPRVHGGVGLNDRKFTSDQRYSQAESGNTTRIANTHIAADGTNFDALRVGTEQATVTAETATTNAADRVENDPGILAVRTANTEAKTDLDTSKKAVETAVESDAGVIAARTANTEVTTDLDTAKKAGETTAELDAGVIAARTDNTEVATQLDTAKKEGETTAERDARVLQARAENTLATGELETAKERNKRLITEAGTNQASPEAIAGIDAATRTGLHTSVVEQKLEAAGTAGATRVQSQEYRDVLTAGLGPGGTGTISPEALRAGGIDARVDAFGNPITDARGATRGATRAVASAQFEASNADRDEVNALSTSLADGVPSSELRGRSADQFTDFLAVGDSVGMRSAAKNIMTTGGGGKQALARRIEAIPAGPPPIGPAGDGIRDIKSYLLEEGIKTSDLALAVWATDPANRSLNDVRADPATYDGLGSGILSTQTEDAMLAAAEMGVISVEVATETLAHDSTNRELDGPKRAILEAIRDGNPIPPHSP